MVLCARDGLISLLRPARHTYVTQPITKQKFKLGLKRKNESALWLNGEQKGVKTVLDVSSLRP